jgi:hypothetical protein
MQEAVSLMSKGEVENSTRRAEHVHRGLGWRREQDQQVDQSHSFTTHHVPMSAVIHKYAFQSREEVVDKATGHAARPTVCSQKEVVTYKRRSAELLRPPAARAQFSSAPTERPANRPAAFDGCRYSRRWYGTSVAKELEDCRGWVCVLPC